MKTPKVQVKPAGQHFALHVTHIDGTTHVPAYYDTEAKAQYVAGNLQGRYDQAPAAASTDTDVLRAIDTVIELGGHNIPALHAAQRAQCEEDGDPIPARLGVVPW